MAAEDLEQLRRQVQPYIGKTGDKLVAPEPLTCETLRRFCHAAMDRDPVYHSREAARAAGYDDIVAPHLYPLHAFVRPFDTDDQLEVLSQNPDADGTQGNLGVYFGLEPIALPTKRLLNGGNRVVFQSLLMVGERCCVQARYSDITVKEGRSGILIFVVVESSFSTESGRPLLVNKQTLIWR